MEFNSKFKCLRLQNQLTQKELSKLLNTSVVTIQCWENGSKKPSMDAIIAIANAFGVSIDYLLGHNYDCITDFEMRLLRNYRALNDREKSIIHYICSLENNEITNNKQRNTTSIRYIPLYETPAAAGISDPIGNDNCQMIELTNDVPASANYAVKIQGNSMLPYISDEEIVYVERDTNINNGDIGIFCVDDAMYCKQFYSDPLHNVTLVSSNPDYRHTNVIIKSDSGSSFKCYGKVLKGGKTPLPAYFNEDN